VITDGRTAPSSETQQPSVPFTRLDNGDPALLAELVEAIEGIGRAGAFTLGQEVAGFENEFAHYCGAAHAVGLSSGTAALELSLRALGIGPGDEVIVPANSFIASAEAVSAVGARPRLVDVDPATALLTRETVERAITRQTACIMPVHLYGRSVDMDPILALAARRGLRVIEDACQAHGARYKGRRVGSLGDVGCFSFYPTKNLGCWGDGGAAVTNSPDVAERMRLLRSHGEVARHEHRVVSGTYRLHAIQAAVLRVKLPLLDAWNRARRRAAATLTQLLEGSLRTPNPADQRGDHVYHLYVASTPRRDALRRHLLHARVASAVHYPTPIHLQPAYAHLGLVLGDLPVAERLAAHSCSLPLFPGITDREIERVALKTREFVHDAGSGTPVSA
jgi:dTDP-3-amino-3,4,6-trideoxy-alpha-D-glucose transaminase